MDSEAQNNDVSEPEDRDPAVRGTDRGPGDEPDVLLDVPHLSVDEISLEVEDLRARVSLRAEVLDLLKLSVGADVELGRVHLDLKGVEAQALLKVRLDNVAEIVGRVLTTIDRNPQILEQVTSGVGEAARDLGGGAREAVGELGSGAGRAVEDVGEGAGGAVEDLGAAAGEVAGEAGRRTGEGVDAADETTRRAAKKATRQASGRSRRSDASSRGRTAGRGARTGGAKESKRPP